MIHRLRVLRALGVAALAVLAAVLLAAAPAAADPGPLQLALLRDLGWSAGQARDTFAAQHAAAGAESALREELGPAFAGAWLAADGLRVAVTDPANADRVRAAGAVPAVVAHSAAELDGLLAAIDGLAADGRAPQAVTSWYVDPPSNSVVVTVARGAAEGAAAGFLARARQLGDAAGVAVRVVETTAPPQLRDALVGGDAIFVGRARCSLGFSARTAGGAGRIITAGHCTQLGPTVAGTNGQVIGPVTNSTFGPAGDFGAAGATAAWQPTPTVAAGPDLLTVTGHDEAPVGAAVCRSGSTSGYHCGTITAKDVTVNYQQGVVRGLTQTTACSEPGDSGGPFVAGSQAQGVLSGGTGDCTTGGGTLFEPVGVVLASYGLTLVTG